MTPYYDHNGITIFLGDCLTIMPQLDVKVDLVLTDPPYGERINQKTKNYGIRCDLSRKIDDKTWDNKVIDNIYFKEIFKISKNQIIFGANYYWENFYSSRCYIIWDKRDGLPNVPFCDTEFAWTSFTKKMSKKYIIINHGFIKDKTIINYGHPTQKPLKLFKEILKDFSKQNDLILDPFAGSFTTAVACKQLGRRFIWIELEEKYCEIGVKRLAQEVLAL